MLPHNVTDTYEVSRAARVNPTSQLVLALIVAATMGLGTAATVWGLAGMNWPACIPFNRQGLEQLLLLLGGGTTVVLATSIFLRVSPLAAGAIVATGLALCAGALWPVLVVGWIAVSCCLLGDALVPPVDDESRVWSVQILLGAAVLGTLVGLLAYFPINGPPLYAVILLAPILARRSRLAHLCVTMWQRITSSTISSPSFAWPEYGNDPRQILNASIDPIATSKSLNSSTTQAWVRLQAGLPSLFFLQTLLAVFSLLHFIVGLMPEVAHDGLAMHLVIPTHLAVRGQWGFDAELYAWAVMPMIGNWLFSLGYMFAGEQGARLVNVLFILLLASMIHTLVLWAGGTIRSAAWVIILFLTTPLTFTESSSAFVEPAWASFVVAGVLLLLRVGEVPGGTGRLLPAAGILFGAALSAKAWSLVMLPTAVGVVVAAYPSLIHPRRFVRLAVALLGCVVIGSVPYMTAWWLTGNPVFPFYNQIFQSPFFPFTNFSDLRWSAPLSWKTIYNVTFSSGGYLEARNGAAGFQWLPFLLPSAITLGAGMNRRGLVLMGIGMGGVLAVFSLTSYLRYVFPAEVILLAAIGAGLSALPSSMKPVSHLLLTCVTALNCLFLNAGPNFYDDFPLRSVFSQQARESYIESRVPQRKAVAVVNVVNVDHTPVAILGGYVTAGLASDAVLSSWYNQRFKAALDESLSAEDLGKQFRSRGIDFVILDDSWGTAVKRSHIESLTTPLFDERGVSVRRMRDDQRYTDELLKNPDFGADMTGWSIPECVMRTENHELIVTAACHASQVVAVKPGCRYRNAVTGRSRDGAALARTQLNWLSEDGALIGVDGESFECGLKPTEHVMFVTAPKNAASVVVYTSGHLDTPVIISSNSLRQ